MKRKKAVAMPESTTRTGAWICGRRDQLDLNSPEEMLIRDAVNAVELMGSDVLLTEAVMLLGQARNKVADFIDRYRVTRSEE